MDDGCTYIDDNTWSVAEEIRKAMLTYVMDPAAVTLTSL